jgi:hypothetical protein
MKLAAPPADSFTGIRNSTLRTLLLLLLVVVLLVLVVLLLLLPSACDASSDLSCRLSPLLRSSLS